MEQHSFASDDIGDYFMFNGRFYHGGLKHRKVNAKELKIYSIPEIGDRDMVTALSST